MIIADFLDFAIHNFYYFRADRLHFPAFRVCAMKERFGHAATTVAGAQAQIGVSVLSLKNHTVSAPRPENSMGYKSITKSSVTRHAVVRAASKLMQNQSVASLPQRGV